MSEPPVKTERVNPRFNRSFPLTLSFDHLSVHGRAVEPSAYGCNVEITEYEYNQLVANPALWENRRRIAVSTNLNELCAEVNNLKISESVKYLISIRLCDDRSWYD